MGKRTLFIAALLALLMFGAPEGLCVQSRCGPVQTTRVCDQYGKCIYYHCQTCCHRSGHTTSCFQNCWQTQN